MKKTKETDTVLLAQQILEMRHMYSKPLISLKFSTKSTQQTQLHTQLHAKGDPTRNNLDTPQQHKLACYSRRMKPHSQTLQSNQSQHAASSRTKPQSWTLQWDHNNAIPSQMKKTKHCWDPNQHETHTEWNHKAKHCRGTHICMQCKQNETTPMNTHSHIKRSPNRDNPHLIPDVLALRVFQYNMPSIIYCAIHPITDLSHVYSLYQLQYTHCTTKKVTTFRVMHTERPEEWSCEFLDVQAQIGAKGDCNTRHVTIPFVTDLTKNPN